MIRLLLIVMLAGVPVAADAQQPQSSSPPAPAPNRLNDVLPSWLRLRGEFRERMEGFDDFNFTPNRDDAYWLTRVRLNATVVAASWLSLQAQAQDARVASKEVGPNNTAPFHGAIDLRTGFADVGRASSPVVARVGRQELAYGDQRLLGPLGWTNTARSFDGARVTLRRRPLAVDLFAASVVRILPDEFDKSGAGNRLAGAYGSATTLIPHAVVEPYVIWHRDVNLRSETGSLGTLHQLTSGARVAGTLPGRLDYVVEMAKQTGSVGSDTIDAWAGHWQMRESLADRGHVRLTGEYNVASGDANPTDGTRGTFDQLYPTGHDKYGLADQIGWRNTRHVRAGLEFAPLASFPVTTNYYSWWLAERRDGLYTAAGTLLARIPSGAASTRVGQELDVQVSRTVNPQVQVAAGYAHIFTGPFLREATPGASYSYPYVMVTYVFLAAK